MYRCIEILKEYDHLVAHDVHWECSKNFTFGCFFRKYGATLLGVSTFSSVGVVLLKRKVDEIMKRSERKNI